MRDRIIETILLCVLLAGAVVLSGALNAHREAARTAELNAAITACDSAAGEPIYSAARPDYIECDFTQFIHDPK